ncbi:MAG: glycosyltransferase family 4 protein [Blastochloris sp.]|nr:glycosyltransferase family 4 protein [Blastochloris sp.]
MHIAIDASRLAATALTGTERYSYELVTALARCDRSNRYTLYCNQRPATLPPLGSNFTLRRIPFPRVWTHVRLSAEMLRHPPDTLFIPAHVLPLAVPLLRKTRTVVTVHDLGYLRFPEAHTRVQRLYLRLSTLWSARVATHIIAISSATRADLVRMTGVSPEKITVVHHGLSPRFRPVEDRALVDAALERYRITTPYFLYVGTIQPRKNLERLIESFARLDISHAQHHLQSPISNLQLVLAGKRGWLSESIVQRVAELGITDRVRFTGYVDDADLPALLSGACAFVFPSLYEGFGMPVLEAMACGAPVLTANTSSLPEVAGDAALLIDPENTDAMTDGLARLLEDASLRADLRARGLARAAQFTWDRCAAETYAVLVGAPKETFLH